MNRGRADGVCERACGKKGSYSLHSKARSLHISARKGISNLVFAESREIILIFVLRREKWYFRDEGTEPIEKGREKVGESGRKGEKQGKPGRGGGRNGGRGEKMVIGEGGCLLNILSSAVGKR